MTGHVERFCYLDCAKVRADAEFLLVHKLKPVKFGFLEKEF